MGATLATVRRLALALPGASEGPHFDMTAFRVAKKLFATVPATGDHVHVFLEPEAVGAYCAEFPGVVEELWWGKNLHGCRVVLRQATTPLLRELLQESWRRKAPKRLVAQLDG